MPSVSAASETSGKSGMMRLAERVGAAVNRVHGYEVRAFGLAFRIDGAAHQQLLPQQALVLARGHHRAHHSSQYHEDAPIDPLIH